MELDEQCSGVVEQCECDCGTDYFYNYSLFLCLKFVQFIPVLWIQIRIIRNFCPDPDYGSGLLFRIQQKMKEQILFLNLVL